MAKEIQQKRIKEEDCRSYLKWQRVEGMTNYIEVWRLEINEGAYENEDYI